MKLPELDYHETRRFWEKVDKQGPTDCWNWLGSLRTGYGRIRLRGANYNATEVVLAFEGHFRVGSQLAIHSCDNRRCCNPAHLRYGTASENAYDRAERNVGWYLNRFKQITPETEAYIRDLFDRRSLFADV